MFVDADFALAEALEPTTLDEPAGGDFDASVGRGVGRDVGVKNAEGFELSAVDEGVHEEAASVAEAVGVRQFAVADGTDSLADIAERGAGDGAEGVAQGDVVEVQDGAFLEPQVEVGDDVRVALFIFEDAVAVGVFAGVDGEGARLESELVEGLDAVDNVLQLDAVSADVLDGRGAGFTGDVGEVFDASPAAIDGVLDDVVPAFGSADAEDDLGVGLTSDSDTADAGMDDDAVEVGNKKEVAAGADVEGAELLEVFVAEYAAELFFVVVLHEPACEGGQMEGIVILEGEVFFYAHVNISVQVLYEGIKKGCRPLGWADILFMIVWIQLLRRKESIGAFQNPCVLEVGTILRADGVAALFGLSFCLEAGDNDAEHALFVFTKNGRVAFVLHALLEGECVGAVLKAADHDAVELDGVAVFTFHGSDFLLSCFASVFRLRYGGDFFF